MKMTDDRLEFATTIFVRECLRQYLKLHPGVAPEHLPMGAFCDYPKRDQRALMAAIAKAIEAAGGMNDLYRIHLQQKIEAMQANSETQETT